jgi:integrase
MRITSQTSAAKAPVGVHAAGNGLYLIVGAGGARSWVLRVSLEGKRPELGLGGFAYTSFEDAKAKAYEYRKLAKEGIDPRSLNRKAIPSFEAFASVVHDGLKPTFKNPKHAAQWISTIREFANPIIGSMAVDKVQQADVLRVLHQTTINQRTKEAGDFWLVSNETCNRLAQRLAKVLDVAEARGFRTGSNPVTVIRNANVLPKVKRGDVHHKALPHKDMAVFWTLLDAKTDNSVTAFKLLILTAARTSEILGMDWAEVDLDRALWTVPADRMKAGRAHDVPLSTVAVDLLKERTRVLGNVGLVFQGQKPGKPLSNMSLLAMLRRLKMADRTTAHGMRSTFRDWAGENGVDRTLAEAALAHSVGNKVEAAYARSTMIEQRRPVMQSWANYVTVVQSDDVVVPIRGASA